MVVGLGGGEQTSVLEVIDQVVDAQHEVSVVCLGTRLKFGQGQGVHLLRFFKRTGLAVRHPQVAQACSLEFVVSWQMLLADRNDPFVSGANRSPFVLVRVHTRLRNQVEHRAVRSFWRCGINGGNKRMPGSVGTVARHHDSDHIAPSADVELFDQPVFPIDQQVGKLRERSPRPHQVHNRRKVAVVFIGAIEPRQRIDTDGIPLGEKNMVNLFGELELDFALNAFLLTERVHFHRRTQFLEHSLTQCYRHINIL